MRWRAVLLCVLLIGSANLAGCTDSPQPPASDSDDGNSDRYTYEECDQTEFHPEQNGTTVHIARVSCDANVTGTNEKQIPCPSPGEAELTAATDLSSGSARLRVIDADEATVADHELSDTGGEPRNLSVEAGASGDWTLTVDRLEGFVGTYTAELSCPE